MIAQAVCRQPDAAQLLKTIPPVCRQLAAQLLRTIAVCGQLAAQLLGRLLFQLLGKLFTGCHSK